MTKNDAKTRLALVTAVLLLSGGAESNESPGLATQRAQNTVTYLTQSKGIDRKRILARSSSQKQ